MRDQVETRTLFYGASREKGERILADGFRDEASDVCPEGGWVALHEDPAFFAGMGWFPHLILEVTLPLSEEAFEHASVRIGRIPTGQYLFRAEVLNTHGTVVARSLAELMTGEALREYRLEEERLDSLRDLADPGAS